MASGPFSNGHKTGTCPKITFPAFLFCFHGIPIGRTGGDRTRDPNIKSVVLYQLSYSPLNG